jgi:hypothetical protein
MDVERRSEDGSPDDDRSSLTDDNSSILDDGDSSVDSALTSFSLPAAPLVALGKPDLHW